MQTEISVEIDAPIAQVFDFSINNLTEWSTLIVDDTVINETPEVVGSTFRIVTEERGRRMEFEGVVTHHDPPNAQSVFLKNDMFDLDVEYRFEDLGGRTRLTQGSTVHAKGFLKVMFSLFGWAMKKSGRESGVSELNNLKRILEERDRVAT